MRDLEGLRQARPGFSASQGTVASINDGVQAFDLPPICRTGLAVEPSSIAFKTVPDTTATAGLKVRNTAAADGDELSWTIHESAGSCATPSDVPWLEATVVGDTTTSGATSTRVRVLFNSDGLAPGLCP